MTDQVDYVLYHVRAAARNCADARGKRVLVVGCNRGREVSTFLDEGASKVWGIDVLAVSTQACPLSPDVSRVDGARRRHVRRRLFCFATMEHITNPESAYRERARVTAPRGLMYVVSAPLWNSREGHHKTDIFDVDRFPWIHVRFTSDEIKQMCAR